MEVKIDKEKVKEIYNQILEYSDNWNTPEFDNKSLAMLFSNLNDVLYSDYKEKYKKYNNGDTPLYENPYLAMFDHLCHDFRENYFRLYRSQPGTYRENSINYLKEFVSLIEQYINDVKIPKVHLSKCNLSVDYYQGKHEYDHSGWYVIFIYKRSKKQELIEYWTKWMNVSNYGKSWYERNIKEAETETNMLYRFED